MDPKQTVYWTWNERKNCKQPSQNQNKQKKIVDLKQTVYWTWNESKNCKQPSKLNDDAMCLTMMCLMMMFT